MQNFVMHSNENACRKSVHLWLKKLTSPSNMLSLGMLLLKFNFFGASAMDLVDIGTADNFAILSKSVVRTTGVTPVTGDISTSTIAARATAIFSLTLDSTTIIFSISTFQSLAQLRWTNYTEN